MKGMFKNTSLGCVLFFSVWSQHISSYADTVFLSTYNVDSILNFNSTGIQSTFATAANGLNYQLGLRSTAVVICMSLTQAAASKVAPRLRSSARAAPGRFLPLQA